MTNSQGASSKMQEKGPFPLIIGVSGHIDLVVADDAKVRGAVRRLLSDLKHSYRSSDIVVLSALAEGGDQLFAEVALDLEISLIAVLPMQLDRYEKTFETEKGILNLKNILIEAKETIELPPVEFSGGIIDEKTQYEQLGVFISHYSHILLSLWDGLDAWDPKDPEVILNRKRGGTAHVVYLRENGEETSSIYGSSKIFTTARTILDLADSGPVLRIHVRRTTTPKYKGAPGSLWLLNKSGSDTEILETQSVAAVLRSAACPGDGQEGAREKSLFDRLDRANELCAKISRLRPDEITRSKSFVLHQEDFELLGIQTAPVEAILNAYAVADVMAQVNQKRTYRMIAGLVAALPAAVVAFEFYGHAFPDPRVLLLYLAIIGIAYVIHFFGIQKSQWQSNFQDFRSISEALRVQLFWALGGLPCGVSDYYLRKHQDEMSWIRHALRGPAIWAVKAGLGSCHPDLVVHRWVKSQLEYFGGTDKKPGKAQWNKDVHENISLFANISYFIGLGTATLLLIAQLSVEHFNHELLEFGVCIMGFAPALAAALTIFAEKRAYKDHAHAYSRMGRVFLRADKVLEIGKANFESVIHELGKEALAENGDWLIAHRDRAVEPIKGG
jgi:hypothetical protein